jgi:hypothetical protein
MDYSFETYKILSFISVIVGLGYCFYFILGRFNERVSKQPYNQLFHSRFLVMQLIVAAIIGLIGYYIRQFMLFMPFCFLITFWSLNQLFLLAANRRIILGTTRNAPKRKRLSTALTTIILIMLTFILSLQLALTVGIASTESNSSSIKLYGK